ncbi:microtubule-associated protein futsch isoform X2 [Parasteatoda tepidariorum]|nr:uncharacterized protein LOC107453403 isoform X2 [Parasteatoda tepidariorum]XP_015925711.1 uncharacterized protein LOC107453403 isoform X2 [Parasteatoda tepidariorum]XP_015925712.1 uncharacterized protein LOC107453403 isoform X2 [Parasteatoda tepidariorum]XP_015925713.1 uncharacterized protein LOC107453403 isoform X2 [Parasteatoda tepidariorum]XP_042907691.1 uncharacterized protein LOC107453403 isoform X2 [Parasteatoda tepidariorum]
MKRSPASLDHVPRCALNPQDSASTGNSRKGDGKPFSRFPANRGSGSGHSHNVQRPIKQEYSSAQEWNSTFDNSNTSWESEWPPPSSSPFAKQPQSGGGYYKQRSTPLSYHSSSNDWSTGDSSTSSSAPSSYGGMSQQPASSASYYENNNFYGGYNYDSNNPGGYMQPPYRSSHHPYHHPAVRPCDPYNGNRNPSSCPPSQVKQPDYSQRNSRYGMDNTFNKMQIKKEPEDYAETEGDNFTSLFTKSLTSLYSEDPDNAYREEGKSYEPDIIVCSPTPPTMSNMEESSANYQRLAPSSGHYNSNPGNYQGPRNNNFSFYENRTQNSEHSADVVELGSESERANSFRYDRPSFDDMHLYASPNDTKNQAKKRKLSMPNITPETDGRRKAPRLSSFKSDSQWTPNSFIFSDIQVKREPEDDYPVLEKESQNNKLLMQDSSLNSNGNSNNKSPSQQSDHKPAPRKRSPAATCFDRFEKKSTPTNKKVSPLSLYAKVQDSIVLSVKCRRYKKRTKPIVNKEEVVYPGREEIENWKRTGAYSQTPDHAVRILMGELLERVSQIDGKNITNGPDLMQLDPLKVRELIFQFCQRYSIDFRDFEDINTVLKPRIVQDKMAKNSERASAIRKRTSNSPVQQEAKELASKTTKTEKVGRKANKVGLKPTAKRILRNLPGREQLPEETLETEIRQSRKRTKTPVVRRRYSTRSAKDMNSKDSDVDIVIDSSTDGESEAGKEAEVPKKSDRLKNKQPVVEKPAKDKSSDRTVNVFKEMKKIESNSKSKEKSKEREKSKDSVKLTPKKKWSRSNNDSRGILRSSSIEIVDITRSDSSSPSEPNKDVDESQVSSKRMKKFNRKSRNSSTGSKDSSLKFIDKSGLDGSKKQPKDQDKKLEQNKSRSQSGNSIKNKNNTKNSKDYTKLVSNDVSNCSVTRRRRFRSSKFNEIEFDISNSSLSKISKQKESKSAKNNEINVAIEHKTDSSKMKKENQQPDINKKTSNSLHAKRKNSDVLSKSKKGSENIGESDKVKNSVRQNNASEKETTKNEDAQTLNKNLKLPNTKADNSKTKKSNDDDRDSSHDDIKNTDKKDLLESEATVNGKLSALSRSSKTKPLQKQTDEPSNEVDNSSFKLVSKIKEPLSSVLKEPKHIVFSNKRGSKVVQIAVNKPDIIKNSFSEDTENINNEDKAAKNSAQLQIKKLTRRQSSQHSDSEPQVVLMKLPDVHINSEKSTIPLEFFERYVSKEINRYYVPEEVKSKSSDDNSSVGSPPELVCMEDVCKDVKAMEQDNISKMNLDQKDELSSPLPLIHCNEPITSEKKKSNKGMTPIKQLRYSADSEDSDYGLVIDLDRRTSVEEESYTPAGSTCNEDIKKASQNCNSEDFPIFDRTAVNNQSEMSCDENKEQNEVMVELAKKSFSEETFERKSIIVNNCLKSERTESQDAMSENASLETSAKTESCEHALMEGKSEQMNTQQQNRVESILRSLLLERTSDGSTSSSQPSTSSGLSKDSKARIHEDVRQLLLSQGKQDSFLADPEILDPQTLSDEVQSTYEDLKMALDQLPDINTNLLSDTEDWVYDSKIFKDKLERLKHEIMYLQCVAYQKEKERLGMICLKREPLEKPAILKENDFLTTSWEKLCYLVQNLENCIKSLENNLFPKYMEEVMKRLIKKYHMEQMKFKRQKNGESSTSYLSSEPSTSSGTNDYQSHSLLCRHFLQMASIALSIAKSGVAAALMANEERSSFLSGEQLPTVESMVANATENYGIDMRIVKKCNSSVKQTILEQVLSSKEPTYSQTGTSSSNSDVKNSKLSSLSPQKSSKTPKPIPSSNESPFKPFCPPSEAADDALPHKILLKALSKDSGNSQNPSQSLQTVKPEVKITTPSYPSTSYQEDYPLDFSLDKKSSNIPSASGSPFGEKQKSSSKSSLKHHSNISYSIWKSTHPPKNKAASIDLRVVDHVKETISPSKNSSASSRCSNSPNFAMKSSSANHPDLSQKHMSNSFHQQRSGGANQLTTIANHPKMPPESVSYQHKTERGQTDERLVKANFDQKYIGKKEEERRAMSYSSLVTYGGQNTAPSIPPGMMSPNGSPYRCMGCGISDAKFLCSGCREHWYCSAQCQNMRWPDHALACPGNMYSSNAGSRYVRSPKNSEH